MSLANSLYVALTTINVPNDQAREVVDALEKKMTNDFATKSDIALVRADITAVRSEMKAEFAAVRAEMNAEFAAVRSEMNAEVSALRSELSDFKVATAAEFDAVRNSVQAAVDVLRAEMKADSAVLRAEMNSLHNRTIIQLGALMVVLIGVMPKVMSLLEW